MTGALLTYKTLSNLIKNNNKCNNLEQLVDKHLMLIYDFSDIFPKMQIFSENFKANSPIKVFHSCLIALHVFFDGLKNKY